jgi:hypothetical protein
MYTHLISYDLIRPGKDYSKLIAFLETYTSWAKPLESVWLVKNNLTADQTRNQVQQHTDANDKIFVVTVTKESAAWVNLSSEVSAWIKSSL